MAPKTDRRYLEQRHQTWFAVKDVPARLRKAVGKKRLVLSLKTHTLAVAQARRWEALASFERTLEAASQEAGGQGIVSAALTWRATIERIKHGDPAVIATFGGHSDAWDDPKGEPLSPKERALTTADWELSHHIDAVEQSHGEGAARTLWEVSQGLATPLTAAVEDWLNEGGAKGPLKERTKVQYRTDVGRLGAWAASAGLPQTIEAFTKATAGRYVTETIIKPRVEPTTANRWITAASSYWKWLAKRHGLEGNPWTGQNVAKRPTQDGEPVKRPLTAAEMRALLEGKPDAELADAIRVAALSGMRLEELYRLTVADCGGGWFAIRATKTKAGRRRVPVHSALRDVVERRTLGKPAGAYLFHEPGEASNGRGRSMAASKRFATYRRGVGVDDRADGARSSKVDFHSLRRWFVTEARNAGHDRAMVAAVVGHQAGNLTDDTYSGGPSDVLKIAVVESVRLPE